MRLLFSLRYVIHSSPHSTIANTHPFFVGWLTVKTHFLPPQDRSPPGEFSLLNTDHAHSPVPTTTTTDRPPLVPIGPNYPIIHIQKLPNNNLPGFTPVYRRFLQSWSFHPRMIGRLSLSRPCQCSRSHLRMCQLRLGVRRVEREIDRRWLYPAAAP